jgi:hypothetical protein
MVVEFGRDETAWGRLIAFMINHIMYEHEHEHAHRLEDNLAFFKPSFPEYTRAIARKIDQPAAQLNTVGFIDDAVQPMCRPSNLPGTNDAQRRVYSGHKPVHALKFQGVLSPDGMIMDLFGPLFNTKSTGTQHTQKCHISRRDIKEQI